MLRTFAALCCHPCKQLPPSDPRETRATRAEHELEAVLAFCWLMSSVRNPSAPGGSSSVIPAVPATQEKQEPHRTELLWDPKCLPCVRVIQLGHTRAVLCSQCSREPGASNLLTGYVQPETVFRKVSHRWELLVAPLGQARLCPNPGLCHMEGKIQLRTELGWKIQGDSHP